MTRQSNVIEVVADGGMKKGGDCYGSYVVTGFPGEEKHPFGLYRIKLHTCDNSTEAEAEIIYQAVIMAVSGVEARGMIKGRTVLHIKSDSETLVKKLRREHQLNGNSLICDRVEKIWRLGEEFLKVEYEWIPHSMTYGLFGH